MYALLTALIEAIEDTNLKAWESKRLINSPRIII